MKTVRRLYFYAVALISLEVVLWGLINLLRTMVDRFAVGAGTTLAQALALILVGVPIFLVHWLWAQNASARDQEEQTASLRALFFYSALFATLVPVIQNLLALVDRLLLDVSGISYARGLHTTWPDNVIAVALNLLAAGYFWTVLQREWGRLPNAENFAEIRRLYRYVWLVYSLMITVFGAQQLIRFIFYVPTQVLGLVGRSTFVNGLALLLVGTPLWLFTWSLCQRALADPTERNSTLRLVVLYLLALGGVMTVLGAGGNLQFHILNRLLGDTAPWPDFLQAVSGPVSIGIPLAAVWFYYGTWLNRHTSSVAEGPQREALRRPYQYILSLIGLVTAFIGSALLIKLIVDLALGGAVVSAELVRRREAGSIATLLVGLPLWLAVWLPLQRQAWDEGASGAHARRSLVRRGYLYLVLFASVIGGMVSAVTMVFLLLRALLTGLRAAGFTASVLNAFQLLVLFTIVLLYHLAALRRDGRTRGEAVRGATSDYPILVIDPEHGDFGEQVRMAIGKQSARVLVSVMAASGQIPPGSDYHAVVLPASVAFNAPEPLRIWLAGFSGRRLIVPDQEQGALLAADARQAATIARQLAEGQEIHLQPRGYPAWMIIVYIFAALFALQLLFILFMLAARPFLD